MSLRTFLESVYYHANVLWVAARYLFARRITLRYPEEEMVLPPGYRGMMRLHKDKCIGCSLCARICPADAIKMYRRPGEKSKTNPQGLYPGINYNRCVFCHFCVDICPTEAIEATPVHDVAWGSLREAVLTPEEWEKPPTMPPLHPSPRRMRVEIDEERGLRYVPE